MRPSLLMPPRIFPSHGKCVYCLTPLPPEQLTDEHVIPFALNGSWEIKKAACETCRARSNEDYEQKALNSDLFIPRRLLELRRRKKNRPWKALPSVAIGDATMAREAEFNVDLEFAQYPAVIEMITFPAAGKLVDKDRGADINEIRIAFFNFGFHNPNPAGVTVRHEHINGPFAMTLAKIGYCYAVAEHGLDGFDGSEIRDLLLGRRADVYNFVGGALTKEHLATNHLHGLYMRQRGSILTVLVHLFASCKMPPYEVVVGKLN